MYKLKELAINGEDLSFSIPDFLAEAERVSLLINYNMVAEFDNEDEDEDNDCEEKDFLEDKRISRMFVEREYDKYKQWLGCVNIAEQKKYLYALCILMKKEEECEDSDLLGMINILKQFITYYDVYSEHWRKVCFEERLKFYCNTPVAKLNFTNQLKKHKYGTEFCEEYERYIKENPGVKPLFDTKLVLDPIPILIKDDDKEHEKWFESIHISKVKDKTNECLYKAVSKLYETLKDKELIVNAPKDLFCI